MSYDNKPENLHFSENWRHTKSVVRREKSIEELQNDKYENYWYMDTVEDICKEIHRLYGIEPHVAIHLGNTTKGYKKLSNLHFHIDIAKLKYLKKELCFKKFDVHNSYVYENLYTHIAHEFAYISNEDLIYFSISEKVSKDPYMKALETLKEIRADLKTKEILALSYRKPKMEWVKSNSTKLNKSIREEIISKYDNYENNIDELIVVYLSKSKADLINYVKKEFKGVQLIYFCKLLGIK